MSQKAHRKVTSRPCPHYLPHPKLIDIIIFHVKAAVWWRVRRNNPPSWLGGCFTCHPDPKRSDTPLPLWLFGFAAQGTHDKIVFDFFYPTHYRTLVNRAGKFSRVPHPETPQCAGFVEGIDTSLRAENTMAEEKETTMAAVEELASQTEQLISA